MRKPSRPRLRQQGFGLSVLAAAVVALLAARLNQRRLIHERQIHAQLTRLQTKITRTDSEHRYRDLFENANDIVYTLDLAGNLTDLNRKGEEITGYRREELLGKPIAAIVVPENRQPMQQMLERKVAGEPRTTYELRLAARDGRTKTLEVSSRLLYRDGQPVGIHGIARDLSERKRAEEALRLSRDQLQAILGSVADGVMVQTADGKLLYANDAAADLCGFASATDFLTTPLEDVLQRFAILDEAGRPVPPEQLPARRAILTKVEADAILRFRVLGTGRERWATVRTCPVLDSDSNAQFAVSAFQEITAIKRRESEQRLLAEASRILAGPLDYETTLGSVAGLVVSDLADFATLDLLESDATIHQVAVAVADSVTDRIAEQFRDRYLRGLLPGRVRAVVASGLPELHFEPSKTTIEAGAIDQEQRTLLHEVEISSLMVVPLIAGGRTLGALSLAYAGSGRRYTQEDFRLAEELARRVAEAIERAQLYEQARAALVKAQEALSIRDTFLSVAAHELRTPLTALSGHLQLAQRRLQRGVSTEDLAPHLTQANKQIDRLVTLVNELLDVSRINAGRFSITREPLMLTPLVQRVVELAQALEPSRTIVLTAAEPLPEIMADSGRLEQVLANLLDNAQKYSPPRTTIRVHLEAEASALVITVQDAGIGIPEEDQQQIFAAFQRASNIDSRRLPGLGLGLHIVSEIVQAHGGSLTLHSSPGNGSTFRVCLPR
ncbi:MAG: sensor histidine kinase [Dehalococcoidia bacterium]